MCGIGWEPIKSLEKTKKPIHSVQLWLICVVNCRWIMVPFFRLLGYSKYVRMGSGGVTFLQKSHLALSQTLSEHRAMNLQSSVFSSILKSV